jgi:hypothetical protein
MFAEEIHIGWLDLVYIDAIDRHKTKFPAKNFLPAEVCQDTLNHYWMLGFVLAGIT